MGGSKAETLLLGTAKAESGLIYLKQLKGPALGLYQNEPKTHKDTWDNYLKYKPELAKLVTPLGNIS